VIFCRGSAWQDDQDNPIAHCVATFMTVDTPSISLGNIIRRRFNRLVRGDKAYEREADK
jgi:hypothetical protein